MPVTIGCGQCIGCRLDKSRTWAIRMMHEASMHQNNCFLTLTYNDENLPPNGTLVKKHFQDFMKRYRKKYASQTIRFYHCGEYGENTQRPHYHAAIFGHDFTDKKVHKHSDSGFIIYTSDDLASLWDKGYATIGDLTFESAGYISRYITKKLTGPKAEYYEKKGIIPEYSTMSRRPGIGYDWYKKYNLTDVLNGDFIIINGKKCKVPRFYDNLLEESDLLDVKKERTRLARKFKDNNTTARLRIREECHEARAKQLLRDKI